MSVIAFVISVIKDSHFSYSHTFYVTPYHDPLYNLVVFVLYPERTSIGHGNLSVYPYAETIAWQIHRMGASYYIDLNLFFIV